MLVHKLVHVYIYTFTHNKKREYNASMGSQASTRIYSYIYSQYNAWIQNMLGSQASSRIY